VSGIAELSGKVAVVTGGASGIGAGIARQLVAEGMKVVIADIEQGPLDEAAAAMGATGVRTDVSDADSVQALADAAVAQHGAVHLVVNNAGVGPFADIVDLKLSDWRWVLEVNLFGVIHGVQAFLPLLLANAEGGHVVNTASLAGLATLPGGAAYSVSKHGIVSLTEILAAEMAMAGGKVGASVLVPGTVRSNIASSSRNRPEGAAEGGLKDVDLESSETGAAMRWLDPDDVGRMVVQGIKAGDLYIVTHPETWPMVKQRHDGIEAAFTAASAAQAVQQ
jgi:NAD(P)-dependent dehydrogenase (short-subunit alcohol dehydrogenase family)